MNAPERRVLAPLPVFESELAGLFIAQMDDQSRRLTEDTRGLGPEELGWQPAPGTNTIGMLLAHIAIVEVYWLSVLTESAFLCEQVLGIGGDDDGMPIADQGAPPSILAGRRLEFFDDLLARARRDTVAKVRPRSSEDLAREIEHRRRHDVLHLDGRWILYHLLEHEAGHYGQINLLRHLYRTRTSGRVGSAAGAP